MQCNGTLETEVNTFRTGEWVSGYVWGGFHVRRPSDFCGAIHGNLLQRAKPRQPNCCCRNTCQLNLDPTLIPNLKPALLYMAQLYFR